MGFRRAWCCRSCSFSTRPHAPISPRSALFRLGKDQPIRHVVLNCAAVNVIDLSALESLEELNRRLGDMGISLNLSEVKGPVMDRLQRTHFLDALSGQVFLTHFGAMKALGPVDGMKPVLNAAQ